MTQQHYPMEFLRVDGISDNTKSEKTNVVSTARYTRWTFLPTNLFEQLSQPPNLYFFIVGLLQMIPTISVTGGLPAMWLPLSQVMLVVGILEGYADWKRYQSDLAENSQLTKKIEPKVLNEFSNDLSLTPSLHTVTWDALSVGDIIICSNRDSFPADLLILASSRSDGRVMVETASLDGETNLKFRFVPNGLFQQGLATYEACQTLHGTIMYDPPSPRLDCFRGTCSFQIIDTNHDETTIKFPIGLENVVLRGCKLRNTEWVVGLVVYAGHNTKLYQNTTRAPKKISRLETETRFLLFISFLFLLGVCLAYSVGSVFLDLAGYTHGRPFTLPKTMLKRALTQFASWNLLIVNVIPISLFFFLNISRALQAQAMQHDKSMQNPETLDGVTVRNDKLNSDLGQVQCIFTDKTGTLTRNYMELKRLCIDGHSYGQHLNEFLQTPHVNIDDPRLRDMIQKKDLITWDFFLHLAVNHSVFLESSEFNSSVSKNGVVYSASSADEGVLVYSAYHFGFPLMSQSGHVLDVQRPDGIRLQFEVIARFHFDSERKRSSVLVRWTDPLYKKIRIVLFTKGADNIIRERLNKEHAATHSVEKTFQQVGIYAKEGLRTLCITMREITEELLEEWTPKYEQAITTLNDEETVTLINELETNLILLGCVGVEDKLAEHVALTIEKLKGAHIQIVMLTGDKLETAVNIGMQTRIIPDNAKIIRIDCPFTAVETLRFSLSEAAVSERYPSSIRGGILDKKKFLISSTTRPSFVIDSAALQEILYTDSKLIGTMISISEGVIICRATPQQKADVVLAVRQIYKNKLVTLAIGDGGNDCNMIQSANIGIGIKGLEGLQAFNVSDYGVPHFKALAPLLLIHGRWNHRRLGKLVMYTLSKMIVINVPQVLAGLLTFLTRSFVNSSYLMIFLFYNIAQRIFAESINQFVNPIFSSLAPVLFAVLDCDISGETAIEFPSSYLLGTTGLIFSAKIHIFSLLNALFHGMIAFGVPFILMGSMHVDQYGRPADLWVTGTTAFFCALFLMTQKLNLDCISSLPIVLLVNLSSVSVFFAAITGVRTLREMAAQLLYSPLFYIAWMLSFFLGIFRDYFWKVYKRNRRPSPTHQLQLHMITRKKYILTHPSTPSRKTLDEYCFFDNPDPSVINALNQGFYRRSN